MQEGVRWAREGGDAENRCDDNNDDVNHDDDDDDVMMISLVL
jgi:hypothetical protein